ncbi:type I restriction-modification system subunit S [Cuniculiplasma divulgatum]|uniref:Type I restriction-modification system subunit S n=2 Tax=Cuniculiplasma divulgatum TaxID=1673428 RepID=A0A1N5VN14_9ARCH|nr:type I restriction-modification system subunit S [Cuniculiplasma divulgatum]
MTEIGEIPEEWEAKPLSKVATYINGMAFKPSEWRNSGIPIVRIENLNSINASFNYYQGKFDSRYLLGNGEILLSWSASLGVYIWNRGKALLNQHIFKVIPVENVSKQFLFWVLHKAVENLSQTTHGSTMKHFKKGQLEKTLIWLPPLPEQQKIAEILATADDEIQKVDEQITLTEQFKKGLMQRLLTRGIGHTRFKTTEIGEIPEEWDVKKIRELRQNIYYGITAKATKENTNLRMLRTTDIKNFKFDLNNLPFCQITEKRSDLSKYFLKRNDIIIARAGTVGVSILVEENLNNVLFGSYLIKIIFKQETIDMPFIHYYFQSQLYWNNISNAQGSTIKNINLPFLNSLEIPLPPIPEQQKIAEILSTVDNKLELLGTKRDKLNVLKKGLMNDLLTGKVRVKV